jgi:hypothetical protein
MPRRPPYSDRDKPLGQRIVAMFTDPRSWSSLFYMLMMLPLGIIYFTLLIVSTVIPVALMAAPVAQAIWHFPVAQIGDINFYAPAWTWPIEFALGFIGLFLMLHVARGIGRMHGSIAKSLLVKTAA